MEKHARDIIKHEGWLQTSPETLATLTSRDSFNLLEIDLFSAILKWTKVNSGTDVGNVIGKYLLLFLVQHILYV